jgi:hypothetical protein
MPGTRECVMKIIHYANEVSMRRITKTRCWYLQPQLLRREHTPALHYCTIALLHYCTIALLCYCMFIVSLNIYLRGTLFLISSKSSFLRRRRIASIALQRIALHCIALHCIALHCIAACLTTSTTAIRNGQIGNDCKARRRLDDSLSCC